MFLRKVIYNFIVTFQVKSTPFEVRARRDREYSIVKLTAINCVQ